MEVAGTGLVRKGDYIGGCFFKPETVDGFINGINPGDRSDIMGRFPFSRSSVNEAFEYARTGSRTWKRIPLADRIEAVRAFRDHLSNVHEELARRITRETGKPIWESRQELLSTAHALTNFTERCGDILAPIEVDGGAAYSERLPRGTIAAICPFTYPIRIPALQSAAAIMTGNAVILKPSKFAPGCGQAVAELWDRCRIPRGVFNLVQGPGSIVGKDIIEHEDLNGLVFEGSYPTALTIQSACSQRPELPLFMQFGGKATALVFDDADIEQAVYEVMIGAFITTGQRHNGTGRVIVCADIYDEFVSELVRRCSMLSIGYGMNEDSFMGPLITESQRSRYRRFSRKLDTAGHTVLMAAGSERTALRGFYVRPSIYRIHWQQANPIWDTEPPGPTLLVYRAANWTEAIALHNQMAHRPVTSVFTQRHSEALENACERLRTGGINVNRATIAASFRLPGQAQGRSSNGHGTGMELLRQLSHARPRLTETRNFDSIPVLPGTNWRDELALGETTAELELEDDDEVTGELETI